MLAAILVSVATLQLSPCNVKGVEETLRCGTLNVPERRDRANSRTIGLHLVVLPSIGEPRYAPLFEAAGGPGIGSTSAAFLYAGDLRGYREHRDVVLVDQRGTGESHALQCDASLLERFGEMYPETYVRDCRDKLSKVADLTAYTTDAAADDLDAVRAALGFNKISLQGLSYGSRLAMVYARRHPEHVDRIILIGATPVWASLPLFHAANAQRALDLLFDDCGADEACRSKHGDVRAKFLTVMSALRQNPTIKPEIFAEKIRSMLYLPLTSRKVPRIIDDASRGDFVAFTKAARAAEGADGLYLSVTCAEDVPLISGSDAERMTKGTYFGDYRVREQVRACSMWPHPTVASSFWEDVKTNAPVLIYSGYRDPVTPPTWSYAIASVLPNATVLLIPNEAHLPIGLSDLDCWDGIAMKFLNAQPFDPSCLAQMKAPPFE